MPKYMKVKKKKEYEKRKDTFKNTTSDGKNTPGTAKLVVACAV